MKDYFSDKNLYVITIINAFFVYGILLPAYWIFIG